MTGMKRIFWENHPHYYLCSLLSRRLRLFFFASYLESVGTPSWLLPSSSFCLKIEGQLTEFSRRMFVHGEKQVASRSPTMVARTRWMAKLPPCQNVRGKNYWNWRILLECTSRELQVRVHLVSSDTKQMAAISTYRLEPVGSASPTSCYSGARHNCHEGTGEWYTP